MALRGEPGYLRAMARFEDQGNRNGHSMQRLIMTAEERAHVVERDGAGEGLNLTPGRRTGYRANV
jgi:hypothetical protein